MSRLEYPARELREIIEKGMSNFKPNGFGQWQEGQAFSVAALRVAETIYKDYQSSLTESQARVEKLEGGLAELLETHKYYLSHDEENISKIEALLNNKEDDEN